MSSNNTNVQTSNSGAKDLSFGGQKRSLGAAKEHQTKDAKGKTFKGVKNLGELDLIMRGQRYDRVQEAKERRQADGKEY